MDIRENYNFWCTSLILMRTQKQSFRAIEGDENEIKERFIWTWSSEQQDCEVLSVPALTG